MIDSKKININLFSSNRRNKILFGIGILLLCLVMTITFSVELLSAKEEKSVEIVSSGWKIQEPGSWHITKSADWVGVKTARVTFDVESVAKMGDSRKDIILVLDISGSMNGDKLDKVKEDAKELVEVVLSDSRNNVALISFHSSAEILSGFTNDKDTILSLIDELTTTGATNYTDALIKVGDILENYEKPSKTDLVTLFLSDGYPCVDTPNQIAEFTVLKDQYPYLTINAIQYEMGGNIIKELSEISHGQFLAYKENLSNVLFDAAAPSERYEKFVVNDFIDERFFELGSIENVEVSIGTSTFGIEDGLEKVTWDLGNDYRTGAKATMTIDIKLKENVDIDENSLFSTNNRENIEYKLNDESEKKIESKETPKLKGAYNVIYEPNTPPGCSISNISVPKESHFVFDTITIKNDDLSNKCSGYLFKGWEMTDDSSYGTNKLSEDIFIMPSHDVTIKGVWTQVAISKSMVGTEYQFKNVMPFNGEEGFMDNESSEFVSADTGVDFGKISSDTNGKGLYIKSGTEEDAYPIFYYRGAVDNNNVLFAEKCWKIVRTTETGGTKLIYNGLPDISNTEGMCANSGTSSQLPSLVSFNANNRSAVDVGYMFGNKIFSASSKTTSTFSSSIVMGNDVDYVNGQYILKDTYTKDSTTSFSNVGYRHYTCMDSNYSCSSVFYVLYSSSTTYYLTLTDGKKILDILDEMIPDNNDSRNSNDSTIKKYIDDWFAGVGNMTSYDDFLEDAVWCNDRSIGKLGSFDKDSNIGITELSFSSMGVRYLTRSAIPTVKNDEACINPYDRFTVGIENGNGKLTYKVGLITGDEAVLSGYDENSYLNAGQNFWTLSPSMYIGSYSEILHITTSGKLNGNSSGVASTKGVRPSVSLKQGVVASSGTGTAADPYRVG